jgi:hypothetical protein
MPSTPNFPCSPTQPVQNFKLSSHGEGKSILRSQYEVPVPKKIEMFVDLIHGVNDFPPGKWRGLNEFEKQGQEGRKKVFSVRITRRHYNFLLVMNNKSMMENLKIEEMVSAKQEPYRPLIVGVGSRGAADRITLRWIPIGPDGKPVIDPNVRFFLAILMYE